MGVSVGKQISSHAAYLLQNDRALVVGNDTVNKTYTLMGNMLPGKFLNLPSQIYWSYAISRAYLLAGHSVTHFVLDHASNVPKLMDFPLYDRNKITMDLSKGQLNILEVVGATDFEGHPERITGRFTTHLNNIIALLSQYRDVDVIKTTDDFASVTRSILTDFFVANKYYAYNPMEHLVISSLPGNILSTRHWRILAAGSRNDVNPTVIGIWIPHWRNLISLSMRISCRRFRR